MHTESGGGFPYKESAGTNPARGHFLLSLPNAQAGRCNSLFVILFKKKTKKKEYLLKQGVSTKIRFRIITNGCE